MRKKEIHDSLWKLDILLEARIKTKENTSRTRIHSISMAKKYVEFNIQKRIEAEKNGGKDGKALYKLINNAVYGKQ